MNISVIIPAYNRTKYLPRVIESVLSQTFKPFEVIVVDDGSNDDIKSVVLRYPVRYIYQKNSGVSSARNRGVKEAKGEWVAFLDSDDEWHRDKLKKQMEFHEKNPDTLFSHTFERWIRDGSEIKYSKRLKKPEGFCFEENLSACKIAASSVVLHKSIFEDVGYFDESLRVCEDYEYWLRVSLKYKIGLIKEKLVTKYAHDNQLSKSINFIDLHHLKILQKFKDTSCKNSVSKVIDDKKKILLKGALKYKNYDILELLSKL